MAQLPLLVAWRAFNFGMSESAAERKAKKIREEREDKRRSKKRRKEQRKAYNRKHCKAVAIYMPLGPKFILVRHGTVPKALLFSRDGSHINLGLKVFERVPMCRFPVSWGFVLAPLAFWRWAMYISAGYCRRLKQP